MLLRYLSKIISSLLVSLLFASIVGLVLSQTLLNTKYISGQLQKSGTYSKLSAGIAKEVVNDTSGSDISQATITSAVQAVVTPQVVQQRLSTTLTQAQTYYKQGGAIPMIDVSDLVAEAQAAGLPLRNSYLSEPIQLNALKPLKHTSSSVRNIRLGLITVVVLLGTALTGIAMRRHNYKPLANVLVSLGWLLAVAGVLGYLLVTEFSSHITVLAVNNDFEDALKGLINNIGQDIAKRLIIIGAVIFVIGVITRFAIGRVAKVKQAQPISVPVATKPSPVIQSQQQAQDATATSFEGSTHDQAQLNATKPPSNVNQ